MSRPTTEATIGGENCKRTSEPRPYMDELNTSWDLLVIYERQAFQDDLVHLSLKVDEIIMEVSSILTMDGLKVDELLMEVSSILTMDGRVHWLVRPSNFHSGYGSYSQFSGLLDTGNGYQTDNRSTHTLYKASSMKDEGNWKHFSYF